MQYSIKEYLRIVYELSSIGNMKKPVAATRSAEVLPFNGSIDLLLVINVVISIMALIIVIVLLKRILKMFRGFSA